jgi:hypothetical protein
MSAQPIRIKLQARLQSALHIAGPGRAVALVDRPIELDTAGYPLIPASSIRGRLRAHLERLLKAWDQPVCTPPQPAQMCPHLWRGQDAQPEQGYCLACRLFGSAWSEAALLSDDLRLIEAQRGDPEILRLERMSLSVGRRLGTAQSERLFATETTTPHLADEPLCFEGTMIGMVTAEEAGWLLAAVPTITHVGGSKARGLGALDLTVAEVAWWQAGQWMPVATPAALIKVALPDVAN